jgi:hypothetical protein
MTVLFIACFIGIPLALSWTVDATMMGSSADHVVSARIEVAPPPR